MTDIADWSPIDDNNNSVPPAGWPEGMLPSGVNNAARAMQGAIARFYERLNPTDIVTGSVNDIILTYTVPPVLQDGDIFAFLPNIANTGPVTLDVGTGAIPLLLGTAPLRGGELQRTVLMFATWQNDGNFYLSSPAGGPTVSGPPLVLAGGSANALSLAYASGGPTVLLGGDRFTVFLTATNTAPSTLTVQGIGPNNIYAGGLLLVGGEMRVNTIVDFVFDGANFHLLDPALTGAFMPTAGGTFTGPIAAPGITSTAGITAAGAISAPQYNIGGVVFANHFGADGTVIYDGAGGAKIITTGISGGNYNYYRATQHEFSDAAGTGNFALLGNTGLAVTGAITATSNITATGNLGGGGILLGGVPFAAHPSAGVNAIYDGDGGDCLLLFGAASGYANYYRGDTHYFQNNANTLTALQLTTANANFNGNVIAGGQVTGSFVGSTGNINCANFMNAGVYNMAGVALADQVGTLRSLYDSTPLACFRWATTGENSYDNATHSFRSRGALATWVIFNSAGTYNVAGGAWQIISDADLKQDIAPYERGLDAVLKLRPVSYSYAAGPFADDEKTRRYGLVAQDVEPVAPEMVGQTELEVDGVTTTAMTIDPGKLWFMLINSCKELASRIERLEAQLSAQTEVK